MSESVPFDRAAEYYDVTRGLSAEGVVRTIRALSEAFSGAARVLEVGVGTGQVAIPLREAGIDLVGLDLSRPMLERLRNKTEGGVFVPLVEGDATLMPFRDDAFGGAYLRWVLHLISDWRRVVHETARVVRPGGRFLVSLGSYGGAQAEIQARFAAKTGVPIDPVGLAWDGWHRLDETVAGLGGEKLPDVTFADRDRDDLEHFVRGIEANRYSWTWAVTDDAVRAEAAADVRAWAEERWGPLDRVPRATVDWRYAVYRLP
ncbi:MAG TPA: class I SAM-dependent methyltransferase [Actinomycetota bacterium]|nr:class I SAM-dependent methyltransferase [Actinomycetota bacterium]